MRQLLSPFVWATIGAFVGFALVFLFFVLIAVPEGRVFDAITWDFIQFFGKAWAVIGGVIGFVAGLIRLAIAADVRDSRANREKP